MYQRYHMNIISMSYLQYVEMVRVLKTNAQLNQALKASEERNKLLQQQLTVRIFTVWPQ